MEGDAAEGALAEAKPGEIDRVVLLAHGAYGLPEKLTGPKLFIVSRDDPGPDGQPRLLKIRAQYEKAPDPKSWLFWKARRTPNSFSRPIRESG